MLRASPFHRIPELLTSSARLFTLHTCPRVARALKLPLISGYWGAGTPTCGIRPPLTHTRYCALQSASKGFAPVCIQKTRPLRIYFCIQGVSAPNLLVCIEIQHWDASHRSWELPSRATGLDAVTIRWCPSPTGPLRHKLAHTPSSMRWTKLLEAVANRTPRRTLKHRATPSVAILPLHSFDVGGGLMGSPIGLSLLTSADPAQVKLPSRPTMARSTSAPASQTGMHYWPCGSQDRDPEWDRSGRRLHDHSLVRMCSI